MARAHQTDHAPSAGQRRTKRDGRLQHPAPSGRSARMNRARWLAPFRRLSLSVKLAALGAAVTGAVVLAAFVGLSVQTRNNTREVFAAQLARNQQTLQNLQERVRLQLVFTVSLISEGPAFQYSLKQFQVEAKRGAVPDPAYVLEMQRHLDRLGESARADLLVLTDDSARVFAAAGAEQHAI